MNQNDETGLSKQALDQFLSKQEITELVYRYCRGIDRYDFDLVRSCYHDDAIDDHGVVTAGPDEFIAYVREAMAGMISSMHMIGNVVIQIEGDVAGCEAYAITTHRLKNEAGQLIDATVGVRYIDRLERRNGPWLIAYRAVAFEWSRVDTVQAEMLLGPNAILGRRDREDESYGVLAGQRHRTKTAAGAAVRAGSLFGSP